MDHIHIESARKALSQIPRENILAWEKKTGLPHGMTAYSMLNVVERRQDLESCLDYGWSAKVIIFLLGIIVGFIFWMIDGYTIATTLTIIVTTAALAVVYVVEFVLTSRLDEAKRRLSGVYVELYVQDFHAFVDSRHNVEQNLYVWATAIVLSQRNLRKAMELGRNRNEILELGDKLNKFEDRFNTIFHRELRFGACEHNERDRIFTRAEENYSAE